MDERVFAGTIEVEAVVRVLDGGDRQPAPSQGGQQRGDQRRFSRPAAPDKSDHSHGQARVEGVLGQTADFGAVKTSTVTAGPVYFSTSPTIEWPQLPWPSLDVPMSMLRLLTSPYLHKVPGLPGSSGSYQPPSLTRITPGRIASVTLVPARIWPRSLNTRTT